MNCIKKCLCSKCEMCNTAHLLIEDDTNKNPFIDNTRYDILGYHCMYNGCYAIEQEKLKIPQFNNDWIFTSKSKTAKQIIKKIFQ